MTDNRHVSEEDVEDTAERLESDADVDTDGTAEEPGKHSAVDEADEADDISETDEVEEEEVAEPSTPKRAIDWSRVLAFGVLPGLAFLLVIAAGALKFIDSGMRESNAAREESVQAAKDSTIALLSYTPDNVEQQLTAARDRLTGGFRDEYTELTNNVVIPGAKQKQISAVATVPAAASVSADPGNAVVLLFVNQTVTVGADVPTDTASSVRVTLDKNGDRWLISSFEPV